MRVSLMRKKGRTMKKHKEEAAAPTATGNTELGITESLRTVGSLSKDFLLVDSDLAHILEKYRALETKPMLDDAGKATDNSYTELDKKRIKYSNNNTTATVYAGVVSLPHKTFPTKETFERNLGDILQAWKTEIEKKDSPVASKTVQLMIALQDSTRGHWTTLAVEVTPATAPAKSTIKITNQDSLSSGKTDLSQVKAVVKEKFGDAYQVEAITDANHIRTGVQTDNTVDCGFHVAKTFVDTFADTEASKNTAYENAIKTADEKTQEDMQKIRIAVVQGVCAIEGKDDASSAIDVTKVKPAAQEDVKKFQSVAKGLTEGDIIYAPTLEKKLPPPVPTPAPKPAAPVVTMRQQSSAPSLFEKLAAESDDDCKNRITKIVSETFAAATQSKGLASLNITIDPNKIKIDVTNKTCTINAECKDPSDATKKIPIELKREERETQKAGADGEKESIKEVVWECKSELTPQQSFELIAVQSLAIKEAQLKALEDKIEMLEAKTTRTADEEKELGTLREKIFDPKEVAVEVSNPGTDMMPKGTLLAGKPADNLTKIQHDAIKAHLDAGYERVEYEINGEKENFYRDDYSAVKHGAPTLTNFEKLKDQIVTILQAELDKLQPKTAGTLPSVVTSGSSPNSETLRTLIIAIKSSGSDGIKDLHDAIKSMVKEAAAGGSAADGLVKCEKLIAGYRANPDTAQEPTGPGSN